MPTVLNMRRYRKATGSAEVPPGAVYIGWHMYRAGYRIPGSKWRNQFRPDTPDRPGKPGKKRDGTREEVVAKYRAWLCDDPQRVAEAKAELRGRDLVCWCAPLACHGDVLLEIANG